MYNTPGVGVGDSRREKRVRIEEVYDEYTQTLRPLEPLRCYIDNMTFEWIT